MFAELLELLPELAELTFFGAGTLGLAVAGAYIGRTALVTRSVAWECGGEYLFPPPWLILPTVSDTLSDLTVMFCVGYLCYRVAGPAATGREHVTLIRRRPTYRS